MSKNIVSFDFDGVLSEQRFQDLASEIIKRGFEVIILTARGHFSALEPSKGFNRDIYRVAEGLSIPERNIIFTNFQDKSLFVNPERIIMHIDDCDMVIDEFKQADKRFNPIKHTDYSNNELLAMLPVIFDEEKVKSLADKQTDPMRHPYTCDGNGKCKTITSINRNLIPKQAGWVCACGVYKQLWSH